MARSKKVLVGANKASDDEKKKKQVLLLIKLVNTVRRSRKQERINVAFNQIVEIMQKKINQLVYKFHIPGCTKQDIEQEALFALRYKAIKDYDSSRSERHELSPFDKFAMLCMRRHLATQLKASYQNKSYTLNTAASLDRDRSCAAKSEENLFLSDIISTTDGDVVEALKKREYFVLFMNQLYKRLSPFEQEVLKLYSLKYSYNEIADIMNKRNKKKKLKKNLVKSVDNALSRIKNKGKEVLEKYGDEIDRKKFSRRNKSK